MATTSLLQKVRPPVKGKSNWGAGVQPMRSGETEPTTAVPLQRAPASNFGTGVQPARRAANETNPAPIAPRNLGTMTGADLNRTPTGSVLGQKPALTGSSVRSGYAEYSPVARANSPRAAAPLSPTPAAPVTAPTTVQAQQTESANPLTGDTNQAAGGTTQAVNPGRALGFNRAGSTTPAGQDAAPSTQDNIRAGIQGTQAALRGAAGGTGLYRRRFNSPAAASIYDGYVKRLGLGV